jgi:hypothetical protein
MDQRWQLTKQVECTTTQPVLPLLAIDQIIHAPTRLTLVAADELDNPQGWFTVRGARSGLTIDAESFPAEPFAYN